jgi:hypothetical protein
MISQNLIKIKLKVIWNKKRFNEEFDPMGSWNPKHPSNLKKKGIFRNSIRYKEDIFRKPTWW